MGLQHKDIAGDTNDWDHEQSGTGWYLQVWKMNSLEKKNPVKKESLKKKISFILLCPA